MLSGPGACRPQTLLRFIGVSARKPLSPSGQLLLGGSWARITLYNIVLTSPQSPLGKL